MKIWQKLCFTKINKKIFLARYLRIFTSSIFLIILKADKIVWKSNLKYVNWNNSNIFDEEILNFN